MGNEYAQWDDRPYREPPEPPHRPSYREWVWSSEIQKVGYEAGVTAYLLATCEPRLYHQLVTMAEFYQTWLFEKGVQDPNWKRGGHGVSQEFPG